MLKATSGGADPLFVAFRLRRRRSQGQAYDGRFVDVLLSLWPYLDEESRDALIRERPPSAPILLAAYRRAAVRETELRRAAGSA